MRIQKSFWILFSLSGISLAGAIVSHADIFYRILSASGLIILVCFLWAFFSGRGYHFKRFSRGYTRQQGDFFEENYEIRNKLWISPPWIKIEDQSGLPQGAGNRMISWGPEDRVRRYLASNYLMERGNFQLGPTLVRSGDPLGLFVFSKTYLHENSLKVYPYILPLRRFMGGKGMETRGAVSRIKGSDNSPPQVSGIREYAPGDPLNHIHWVSTAKKEKWMVREFEIDPKPQVWIFLDSCARYRVGSPGEYFARSNEKQIALIDKTGFELPRDTFEYSVCIAASISQYYIKRKVSTGLITHGHKKIWLPAENDDKQLNKILDALALIEAGGDISLAGVVEGYLSSIPRQSTIILISAECENEISRMARSFLRKKYNPIFCLLDPNTFGGTGCFNEIQNQIQETGFPTLPIPYGGNLMEILEN